MDAQRPSTECEVLPAAPPVSDRGARSLVFLLPAALVVLDLAAWQWLCDWRLADPAFGWPDVPYVFFLALAFGQLSLTAIWMALGSAPVVLRVGGALVVGAAWAQGLEWSEKSGGAWLVLVLAQMAAVAAPLVGTRLAGLRLARARAGEAAPRRPVQFALRHLLGSMLVAAGILAVLRGLELSGDDWLTATSFGCCFAIVGLLSIWAALGAGHWLVRLPLLVVLAPAIGGATWHFTQKGPSSLVEFSLLTGLQALFLAGSLLVLRLAGYRLVRQGAGNPECDLPLTNP